jgi:hypothetical protein
LPRRQVGAGVDPALNVDLILATQPEGVKQFAAHKSHSALDDDPLVSGLIGGM